MKKSVLDLKSDIFYRFIIYGSLIKFNLGLVYVFVILSLYDIISQISFFTVHSNTLFVFILLFNSKI